MKKNYTTERLLLNQLSITDTAFIFELVNTQEWKKFIGDRNINTMQDAEKYVQKIIDNPDVVYWVVSKKEAATAIGIITIIKRNYLNHHDIGFAFLPEYRKQGYAFEAAEIILKDALIDKTHSDIVAVTVEHNTNSIALLEKLGLTFSKQIAVDNDSLLLYAVNGT